MRTSEPVAAYAQPMARGTGSDDCSAATARSGSGADRESRPLSADSRFTLAWGSDWAGAYLDGALVCEGHSVSACNLLAALDHPVAEAEYASWYEEVGEELPAALSELRTASGEAAAADGFVSVWGSDWEGLYRDGVLLAQGHSLSARDLILALGAQLAADVEFPASYEQLGTPSPATLAELLADIEAAAEPEPAAPQIGYTVGERVVALDGGVRDSYGLSRHDQCAVSAVNADGSVILSLNSRPEPILVSAEDAPNFYEILRLYGHR